MLKKEYYHRLLTRYFTGNADSEEVRRVDALVHEDESFKTLFKEYEQVWNYSEPAEKNYEPDVKQAWEELNRKIRYAEQFMPDISSHRRAVIKRTTRYVSRIAVAFLLLAGFYYLFSIAKHENLTYKTWSSAETGTKSLVLPDNSKIFAAKNTVIKYPERFSRKKREVKITGEALFEVTHDREHPFVVKAGDVRIKVLGTVFDVRNIPDEQKTVVYLKSGKVLFYSVDKDENPVEQIVLHPGEKGIYNKTTGTITLDKFNNDNFLAWKTGDLIFVNTPLNEVFETLQNVYKIKVISDIPCNNFRLTARYTNETPQTIFEALHLIYGLNYDIKGDTVRVH